MDKKMFHITTIVHYFDNKAKPLMHQRCKAPLPKRSTRTFLLFWTAVVAHML